MSTRKYILVILTLMATIAGQFVVAQNTSGSVNGTVSDSEGRVIPGAAVTLKNANTNIESHAMTNNTGSFVFLNISPGPYTVTIAKDGFKTIDVPIFNLSVNQSLTLNQTMAVGAATETVEVSAQDVGVMLQKSSSDLGTVIQAKEIQQLPLNGRNITSLLILSPGVTPVSTAQGSGISTTDAGITAIPGTAFYKVSFFGQQNRETLYMMDGIVNTDLRGAIYGFLPIVDAMSEFKVQSHIDSAEYGVVTGGIVNMLSKSGTNQFHGSVWEFIRNNAFDARDSFSDFCSTGRCPIGTPTTTPAKPGHYTQNEFGASLGGPLIKNRVFFDGAYEGWRYSKPTLSTTLVPTSQELAGDFSDVSTSYYQHKFYNPYSTVCTGGSCTVKQFQCDASGNPLPATNGQQPNGVPCLKIPSSMLNPTMLAYMKAYYAQPNSLGTEASGYNFVENRAQIDNNNSYQVRLDFHLSDKNFGFGRISQMWVYDSQPVAGTIASNISHYHAYNFGGGFTHVFTPNLLFEVRGGAMLKPYTFNSVVSSVGSKGATDAGFKNVEQYGGMYLNLSAPYTTSNAGSSGDSQRGNPVVNGGGSISWVHGRHTMKAGVDYIYQNRLQRNLYQQFVFSDQVTSNINKPDPATKLATGNSLASALLAAPATFTAQTPSNAEVYFSMQLWAGYVQDSWKATPNLTLNYGLRYEYIPAIKMLNHRLGNIIDFPNQTFIIGKASVPACTSTFSNPCIPGGIDSVPYNDHIRFAHGQQAGPSISDNIGPRFGFAYAWGDKTVINGGIGMFYDTITARSQWVQNNIEGASWPWTTGIGNQQTNIQQNGYWPGSAQNPLTLITNLEGNFPNPVVAPSPWLTSGSYVSQPNYKDQRSVEWNLQVQQQLAPTTLFSLGYAGSKSTRLNYTGFANAARHASNPATTTPSQVDALKYIPWMAPNWHYSTDTGYANYNALLVELQKRFSNSLNSIVSYTWSKALDNSSGWFEAENGIGGGSVVQNYFDPRNAYGTSSYDLRHYLSWSTVYSLPFGKGQRWLQTGVASYLLGGWKANYLFQIRSGQPYNLNVGGDPAYISGNNGSVSSYARPNVVGNPMQGGCGSTAIGERGPKGVCLFNPLAFAIPVGSYGNMGKMPFRLPSYNNLDFSLVKETPLREGVNLELRAESFNTYNVVIAGTPGTTIGNSSAGLATKQGNTPRQLQFAAKIIF
ncbi:MAG TPA: carboxypeptidase regulatory-like domain-containing protein [Edaphobacter sp.]|nr:carboxypeptidase regulatory-like domain-containing protein [Edaphobacter sp.]